MRFYFTGLIAAALIVFDLGSTFAASYRITASYEGILLKLMYPNPNAGGYAIGLTFSDTQGQQYYLEHNGTRTQIGTLGGTRTNPLFVNDYGKVVGSSSLAGDAAEHAFLFFDGSMTDLGTLGGKSSYAIRINNGGLIAGNSYIAGDQSNHAFVYENGSMNDIGTLGGNSSHASDMNENGQIVGSSLASNGDCRAFLWNNGFMSDLGVLGGSYISSEAIDINSIGQVVGNCSLFPKNPDIPQLIPDSDWWAYRPFLYRNGTITDINDLVDESHVPFRLVHSIDDSGQIVVYGSQMIDWGLYRTYSYVLTPVPEPSSIIILAIGLAGIFSFCVRGKKS
ncbi:MAG: PEP-CTERM sorting domain-containing protein [Pirellulales bacterium]|nr:PEP-CTERM sorting domain-containing protein [Pirellulales bacterium]